MVVEEAMHPAAVRQEHEPKPTGDEVRERMGDARAVAYRLPTMGLRWRALHWARLTDGGLFMLRGPRTHSGGRLYAFADGASRGARTTFPARGS